MQLHTKLGEMSNRCSIARKVTLKDLKKHMTLVELEAEKKKMEADAQKSIDRFVKAIPYRFRPAPYCFRPAMRYRTARVCGGCRKRVLSAIA